MKKELLIKIGIGLAGVGLGVVIGNNLPSVGEEDTVVEEVVEENTVEEEVELSDINEAPEGSPEESLQEEVIE